MAFGEMRLSVELDIPPAPAPIRITLAGEFDGEEVPRFGRAVSGLPLSGDRRELCIEAAGLTFLDSAGIRALLLFQERASGAGARVVIGRVSAPVFRVLDISGLVEQFAVSDPARSEPRR